MPTHLTRHPHTGPAEETVTDVTARDRPDPDLVCRDAFGRECGPASLKMKWTDGGEACRSSPIRWKTRKGGSRPCAAVSSFAENCIVCWRANPAAPAFRNVSPLRVFGSF